MAQGGDWELRMHWIVGQMATVLELLISVSSVLVGKAGIVLKHIRTLSPSSC